MPSFVDGFEYDIFISYRQNDNIYDGWVTQFVENLQKELVATIKINISVYFDENPHDGLLETHQVDESLDRKLNCLIFIPIVSQTYCDPNSFAWQHEFLVFKEKATTDNIGMKITLPNGNVSNRILPVRIHNLDDSDKALLEQELGGTLRSIDFVRQAPGVNRPLDAMRDDGTGNKNDIIYRDQINKVANSIKDILIGIKSAKDPNKQAINSDISSNTTVDSFKKEPGRTFGQALLRRNIPQVALVYSALAIIIYQLISLMSGYFGWSDKIASASIIVLVLGGIGALILAWVFEFGPEGLIRTATWKSRLNPYPNYKKKPFTSYVSILTLLLIIVLQYFYFGQNPGINQSSSQYSSIIVLPFNKIDEMGNLDHQRNDGLADDISVLLYNFSSLKVISSAAIKDYSTASFDIKNIKKEFDVEVALITSMRNVNDVVKVNCQLIEVKTSHLIWGGNFEVEKLLDFSSELALKIVDVLGVEKTAAEVANMANQVTQSSEAYDHYLRGRTYYYKYNNQANDSAIYEFKQAINFDSEYALAWAGLADAYGQGYFLHDMDIAWNDSSISTAQHAISLDSTSSQAHKALGNAYYYSNQYNKALNSFVTALELNPNNGQAAGNLGSIYFVQGDFYNSLVWQLKSANLNPTTFIAPLMIGWNYRLLGEKTKAIKWFDKSISIKPYPDTYRELGYTYVLLGESNKAVQLIPRVLELNVTSRNYEQAGLIALFANSMDSARSCFENAMQLNPNLRTDVNSITPLALAYLLIEENKLEEAQVELVRLENFYIDLIFNGSEDDDHRIYLAGIKNLQGDKDGAFAWFKRAIESGWSDLAMMERIPWLKSIRQHPDYNTKISELKARLEAMRNKASTLEN